METFKKLKQTFPNFALFTFALELEELLKSCDSILDVGCGPHSPIRLITLKEYSLGVDGYKPAVSQSKSSGIHNDYAVIDVLDIDKKFKSKSFDAVIALDVIEHLKKEDGEKLIKKMEKIARKKVIILTPNGFVPQHDDKNQLEEHISGWMPGDFKKAGFEVKGLYGWKQLRGEWANLRFQPKIFWGIISELSHYLVTRNLPQQSFSLLCYKDIE